MNCHCAKTEDPICEECLDSMTSNLKDNVGESALFIARANVNFRPKCDGCKGTFKTAGAIWMSLYIACYNIGHMLSVAGSEFGGEEAEVIRIGLHDNYYQSKTCDFYVKSGSFEKEGMTGGMLNKSTPFVCGGKEFTSKDYCLWFQTAPATYKNCYVVGSAGGSLHMKMARSMAASIVIGPDNDRLWVTGGLKHTR